MPPLLSLQKSVETTVDGQQAVPYNMSTAQQFGAGIGQAMERLGSTIGHLGATFQAEQDQRARFQQTTQWYELQGKLDEAQIRAADGARGTNGQDFTKTSGATFDATVKPWLDSLDPKARERWAPQVAQLRRGYMTGALKTEFALANEFEATEVTKHIDNQKTVIARDPKQLDAAVAATDALIDAGRQPAPIKDDLKQKIRLAYSYEAIQAMAKADPDAAEAMAGIVRNGGRAAPRFGGDVDSAISSAAAEFGVDEDTLRRFAKIESGGRPGVVTGSYKGLFQLSDAEFAKHGSGDIFNPLDNARAGARKLRAEGAAFEEKYGRQPTPGDLYLIHQQGEGGYANHMANPSAPAWENMAATAEGRQKGEGWAKQAIWGNLPSDAKARFGSVDNVSSAEFVQYWKARVEGGNRWGSNDLIGATPRAEGGMRGRGVRPDPADPNSGTIFTEPAKGIYLTGDQQERLAGTINTIRNQRDAALAKAEKERQDDIVDGFRTGILKDDPSVTRESIMKAFDDGTIKEIESVKSLLGDLEQRDKKTENLRLGATMLSSGAPVDPFNSEHRKALDAVATHAADPVKESMSIFERTGFMPEAGVSALRRGFASSNPEEVQKAAGYASSAIAANPGAFIGTPNGDDIRKNAALYSSLVDRYPVAEATRRFAEMNDPVAKGRVKVTDADADEFRKEVLKTDQTSHVVDLFDANGWRPGGGATLMPQQKGAMLADYTAYLVDGYRETGDRDAAKKYADDRIKYVWGRNVRGELMKFPAENVYPRSGDDADSHGYLYKQAAEFVKARVGKDVDPAKITLVPIPRITGPDFMAGRPAKYAVAWEDKTPEGFPIYRTSNDADFPGGRTGLEFNVAEARTAARASVMERATAADAARNAPTPGLPADIGAAAEKAWADKKATDKARNDDLEAFRRQIWNREGVQGPPMNPNERLPRRGS